MEIVFLIWEIGISSKDSSPMVLGNIISVEFWELIISVFSSISFLIILPPSPEPLTFVRFIPFSSAIFFAKGEALSLLSLDISSISGIVIVSSSCCYRYADQSFAYYG